MIEFLYGIFFHCRHRRTSFPHRPGTKPGEAPGEMYVVCLDCGKRFHYDWEQMRIGAQIAPEVVPDSGMDSPRPVWPKPKMRHIVAVSALPLIWLIGKRKRSKSQKEQSPEPKP